MKILEVTVYWDVGGALHEGIALANVPVCPQDLETVLAAVAQDLRSHQVRRFKTTADLQELEVSILAADVEEHDHKATSWPLQLKGGLGYRPLQWCIMGNRGRGSANGQ